MSKLIEYRCKRRDREISLGIGNHAAPVIICIVLALLVVALIYLGVPPSDVPDILRYVRGH
jgi:hypothetical protein